MFIGRKIISKNNHEYIFVKEYPNFIMYKDMITGVKQNFNRQELGLVKEMTEKTKNIKQIINH